jgi:hypothetical protein
VGNTYRTIDCAASNSPSTVLTMSMFFKLGLVGVADGVARSVEIGSAVTSANSAMSTYDEWVRQVR